MDTLTSLIKVQWSRAPWEPFMMANNRKQFPSEVGTKRRKRAWMWKYLHLHARVAPLTCIPTLSLFLYIQCRPPALLSARTPTRPPPWASETQSSWPSIWVSSVALESKKKKTVNSHGRERASVLHYHHHYHQCNAAAAAASTSASDDPHPSFPPPLLPHPCAVARKNHSKEPWVTLRRSKRMTAVMVGSLWLFLFFIF